MNIMLVRGVEKSHCSKFAWRHVNGWIVSLRDQQTTVWKRLEAYPAEDTEFTEPFGSGTQPQFNRCDTLEQG